MDTAQALDEMGVTASDFSAERQRAFDEDGYFIVKDFFDAGQVDKLRAAFDRVESGDFTVLTDLNIEPGSAVFLFDLFNKSEEFDVCLGCRPTLAAAHALMGEIRVYSLNGRNPAKGKGNQALHSDVPRLRPDDWRVVNTMILLDDMDESNGATRIVPGSHKWPPLNVPYQNLGGVDDFTPTEEELKVMPEDSMAPHPLEVKITGTAGSIAIINGHAWHGGTRNTSGAPRRLVHLAIGRRDVPPQLDQRQHLTRSLADRTTPAQKYLLDIENAEPNEL